MAQLKPDLEQAERFLALLDPSADFRSLMADYADGFTFQTFDDLADRKDRSLAKVIIGTFDSVQDELLRRNKKRAGVFVTVNETDNIGRRLENITRVRAIWVEDDSGQNIPLPLEPHIITETSPGKFHRILLVNGLTPEQHQGLEEILIAEYGSDPQAKDLSRVLRVPGFFHCKGDPFLVRLIHESGKPAYVAEEVLTAFDYENALARLPARKAVAIPQKTLPSSGTTEYTPLSEDDKFPLPDITLENASLYLPVPGEQTREEWRNVGMALHHQFEGSEEALAIWDEWSQQVREYQGYDDLAYQWHSFNKRTSGPRISFRYLVKDFNARIAEGKKNSEEPVRVQTAEHLVESCDDYMTLVSHVAPALWKMADHNIIREKDFTLALIKRYAELRPGHALTAQEARRAMKQKKPTVTPNAVATFTLDNHKTPYWAKGWVFVAEEERFIHIENRAKLSPAAFNASFNSFIPKDGDITKSAGPWLLDSDLIPKAIKLRYIPSQPPLFYYDGAACMNSYTAKYRAPVPDTIQNAEAVEWFRGHIEKVFGGWNREAQIFVNFLAVATADSPVKIRWAPLLIGAQGDGKSLFHTFVQYALGHTNTLVLNGNLIMASSSTGQTGWCEGQCFTTVEEIKWHGHNRFDAINALKPYLTNDTVTCRRMRQDPYNTLNVTNYLLLSNYKDCVPVDEGDRRLFPIFSALDLNRLEEGYFNKLHEAIKQYAGDLVCWLRSVPIHKDFDVNGPAPMTAAKQSMIKHTSDDFDDMVKELLEDDNETLYGPKVVCFNPLFRRLTIDSEGDLRPTDKYKLTKVLVASNYSKIGRVWVDGERHTVWARPQDGKELTIDAAKALLEERLLRAEEKGLGGDKVVPIEKGRKSG